MDDEIKQWDFGSPLDEEEKEEDESEEEKENEDRDRDKGRKRKQRKRRKRPKKDKNPQKPELKPKKAPKIPKPKIKGVAKGAQKTAQTAVRAGKATAKGAKVAAQAAARSARVAAQATVRVAIQTAKMAIKVGAQVVNFLGKFLANLYVLAAVVIIIIILVITHFFLGAVNEISSLTGGSIFVPAECDNSEHQRIVSNLYNKRRLEDPPRLVVLDSLTEADLDWQYDATGCTGHNLDIRLLKTLDYLTDLHERIEIGMLRYRAPELLRESFLVERVEYDSEEEKEKEKEETKETLSAFYTGQAMAITAIDYSKIEELPLNTPIEVSWQETVSERVTRPIWEELAFSAGYLDRNIPFYKEISKEDRVYLARIAQDFQLSLDSDSYNLYKEAFRKIWRVYQLILRIQYPHGDIISEVPIDAMTIEYLKKASTSFWKLIYEELDFTEIWRVDEDPSSIFEEVSEDKLDIIKRLGEGESRKLLREGIRYVYKALQVANMVNWNRKRDDGDLKWLKAYEARNKIRQVIKELLEMPREASLSGEPKLFDESLVVKQIITFSPEDDLDNGLESLDVFPYGITSVGVGGVGITPLLDSEAGELPLVEPLPDREWADKAVGDGIIDYADVHFSHAPIDNGVFSKHGTNYVYKSVCPDDPWWEQAGALIFKTSIGGQLDALYDLFVGGCIADLNETCKKMTYKNFLHVAF